MSGYSFPAQWCSSFGNQRILNFVKGSCRVHVTSSFSNPKLKSHRFYPPQAKKDTKFISGFTILQLNNVLRLENQRILNFEVVAVRDTKLRSRLSKKIHLPRDF